MNENNIIPYIEAIFRFCYKRLDNRSDAEDLASEIICHILEGMKKYQIHSLDAWIWQVAHNRYARFIDSQCKNKIVLAEDESIFETASYDNYSTEEISTEKEYELVFKYLHTLSSEYKNIFIDYYIGSMSIRTLSEKYSLSETTIKWRLNIGRKKIRTRIGDDKMNKIYSRINWNTTCCNGSMDPNKYLTTQLARAICKATYEKPLTVEEISINTGIPTMYIEDELPRLIYGDAICKVGNKYITNFIIFSLENRKYTEVASKNLVENISDFFENLLNSSTMMINNLSFYGHDFGIERLGYFIIPYVLRRKIGILKNTKLHFENGPFPLRKDGGYGWFIVEETIDESESCDKHNTGCNIAHIDSDIEHSPLSHIYYYWISKYYDSDIYHNFGTQWLCANNILQNSDNGIICTNKLSADDAVKLLQNNLIVKTKNGYRLNFACFSQKQFFDFISIFNIEDEKLDAMLTKWIVSVRKSFSGFVPKHLDTQINQWVSGYLFQIIGYVTDELIRRGTLKKPDINKPLVDGVFFVEGKYINP